jgi:predicted RND superfamily exporter protein
MRQAAFPSKTASIVIIGIMLFVGISAARQLPRIQLQDDLATWLSKDDEHARALEQLESYFPPEERILVSWDTSSLSDPRNDEFKKRVTQLPYISKVRTAAEVVQQITRWKVDENEAIRRLTGVLIGPESTNVNRINGRRCKGQSTRFLCVDVFRRGDRESGSCHEVDSGSCCGKRYQS